MGECSQCCAASWPMPDDRLQSLGWPSERNRRKERPRPRSLPRNSDNCNGQQESKRVAIGVAINAPTPAALL